MKEYVRSLLIGRRSVNPGRVRRALLFSSSPARHKAGPSFLSLSWGTFNAQPFHFVESVGGLCLPAQAAQLPHSEHHAVRFGAHVTSFG